MTAVEKAAQLLEGIRATREGKDVVHPGLISLTKAADNENKGALTRLADIPGLGDLVESIPLVGETVSKVPIGTQLGTYFGLEGGDAMVVDILSDPTMYLGGLGAASKFAGVNKLVGTVTRQKYRAVDNLLQAASKQGRSVEDVQKIYSRAVESTARMETGSFRSIKSVLESNRSGGRKQMKDALDNYVNLVRKDTQTFLKGGDEVDIIGDRAGLIPHQRDMARVRAALASDPDMALKFVDEQIAARESVSGNMKRFALAIANGENVSMKQFQKLVRENQKLLPSQKNKMLLDKKNLKDLSTLYKLEQSGVQVQRRAVDFADQAQLRAGGTAMRQRSVLNFSIPFTDKGVNVVTGSPLFRGIDKAVEALPSLRRNTVSPGLFGGNLVAKLEIDKALRRANPAADEHTVQSVMEGMSKMIKGIDETTALRDPRDLARVVAAERQQGVVLGQQINKELDLALDGIVDKEALAGNLGGKTRSARKQEVMEQLVKLLEEPETVIARKGGDETLDGLPHLSQVDVTDYRVIDGSNMSDDIYRLAQGIASGFDNISAVALEKGLIEESVKHYLPRFVTVLNQKKWAEAQKSKKLTDASGFYQHGIERKVPKLAELRELEKQGIIRVEKDPRKILNWYASGTLKAMSDRKIVERLVDSRMPVVDELGEALPGAMSRGDVEALKKANGADWSKEFDSEFKLVQTDAIRALGSRKDGKVNRPFSNGAYVHRDIATELERILDPGIDLMGGFFGAGKLGESVADKSLRRLITYNSFKKRALLSASVFHALALTESTVASVGMPFGPKGIADALRGRMGRQYAAHDLIDLAAKSGLTFGQTMTRQDGEIFNTALKNAATRLAGSSDSRVRGLVKDSAKRASEVASQGVEGFAKLNQTWDELLWDNYHSGLKTMAWHELYYRGLKDRPGIPHDQIAKAAADHVNNAFGGQNWERFWFGSKSGMQLARLAVLAPDWNLSNLGIAWDVFANMVYRGANVFNEMRNLGAAEPEKLMALNRASGRNLFKVMFKNEGVFSPEVILNSDIRASYARQYAKRASIAMIGAANIANYAFTGRFMGDNPEGRKGDIDTGTTSNGKRRYLSFGKQFKEPFDLLEDPLKFLQKKRSAFATDAIALVAGVDVFGRPIVGREDGPVMSTAKTAGHLASGFLPIGVQSIFRNEMPQDADDLLFSALSTVGAPVREGDPPQSGQPRQQPQGLGSVSLPRGLFTQGRVRQLQRSRLAVPGF